ncbi:unnamed protein product [Paramecium sonneborni]|uniref:Uncharacterized protein n=1 Tax=Paramecium sonneborni TaxID=65129 RepID=A0A8S1R8P7_9CILI|nr:unnamed protein product [Paramecium sonneborni]
MNKALKGARSPELLLTKQGTEFQLISKPIQSGSNYQIWLLQQFTDNQKAIEQNEKILKLQVQFKQIILNQQIFSQQNDFIYFGQIDTIYDGKLKHIINYHINIIYFKLNTNVKTAYKYILEKKDGLSGQAFWNKVNYKSNLLMAFKSKSGNFFSGFTFFNGNQI